MLWKLHVTLDYNVYDVVTDKGWSVNLLNHRIHTVIDDIILTYNETAPCAPLPPCRDCFNWRFVAHDDNEKTNRNCPIHYEAAARVRCLLRQLHSSPVQLIVAVPHHQQLPRQHKHCPFPLPPTDQDPPKKCLKRTWYGWCTKWGYDDDDDDEDTFERK